MSDNELHEQNHGSKRNQYEEEHDNHLCARTLYNLLRLYAVSTHHDGLQRLLFLRAALAVCCSRERWRIQRFGRTNLFQILIRAIQVVRSHLYVVVDSVYDRPLRPSERVRDIQTIQQTLLLLTNKLSNRFMLIRCTCSMMRMESSLKIVLSSWTEVNIPFISFSHSCARASRSSTSAISSASNP